MPKQENIFLDEYTAIISSDCKDYKSFKKDILNLSIKGNKIQISDNMLMVIVKSTLESLSMV